MSNEDRPVGRRAVLRGGLASAVALGAAACTPGTGSTQTEPSSGSGTMSGTPNATAGRAQGTAPPEVHTTDALPQVLRTPGADVDHGPRSASAVALTFHGAGDPGLTREVLAICREHGAGITVFAVGTWLTAHPELGRALVAAGHDLGNHTWSHQPMLRLGRAAAAAEIRDGARAVAAIKGSNPLLFRPSGTQHSTPLLRATARAAGYERCISYDVDPMDYLDPGATAVARRTLEAVRAGSIVSLHLGHRGTVQALPAVLTGLGDRGLTARSVTELLA